MAELANGFKNALTQTNSTNSTCTLIIKRDVGGELTAALLFFALLFVAAGVLAVVLSFIAKFDKAALARSEKLAKVKALIQGKGSDKILTEA